MDTLAHYLWAVALYWSVRKPRKWLAGLTGALPDLLSFAPFIALSILTGTRHMGPPELVSIPPWVFASYNVTHSLIVIGIVAGLLYLFLRDWWWLTWGWALHILCDIPTHTRAFFPTPFLWPLSDVTVSGFSWGQGWFMLLNYAALALAFWWLWRRDAKNARRTGYTR